MKNRLGLLPPILTVMAMYGWVAMMARIYLAFETPDFISLAVFCLVGWFAAQFVGSVQNRWGWFFLIPNISMLLAVPAFFSHLISTTDQSWLISHFLGFLISGSARLLAPTFLAYIAMTSSMIVWFIPYQIDHKQQKYEDFLRFSADSREGTEEVVAWKGDQWYYLNGKLQFTTKDGHMLAEASILPAMQILQYPEKALIIGDDFGLLTKELGKFEFRQIDWLTSGATSEASRASNGNINRIRPAELGFSGYDLMIIMGDPKTDPFYRQFRTGKFYDWCRSNLSPQGIVVLKSQNSFTNQEKLMHELVKIGKLLHVLPYHASIPTLGQQSWILASRKLNAQQMQNILSESHPKVETKWWNQEAMNMMLSFGKMNYPTDDSWGG